MKEDSEDFAELLRMAQRQYELALKGERPIFCLVCHRPFDARLHDRKVYPRYHAMRGSRELCPGTHRLASLTP